MKAKELVEGILAGDRSIMGKCLSLVESSNSKDRKVAARLIKQLASYAGSSLRVGLTGIPGAGKSTLINSLTKKLVEQGHKVAVLANDPSSIRSGGSILGDKTRMSDIANLGEVFIRPSATGGALGGITQTSNESIVILEAAGYDIVFLETVGVGQSEFSALEIVDIFVMVVIPGAGDELQGIKRGIMEVVDMVLVNKADQVDVTSTVNSYRTSLHILHGEEKIPPVLAISALKETGLEDVVAVLKDWR